MKKSQKAGFLRPISSKLTTAKEKERRRNIKREEEERRRKKKAMIVLLVFIGYLSYLLTEDRGLFSGNVIKNPARYINNSPWP